MEGWSDMASNGKGNPTLSLVLPIYNTEEGLLESCFASIAASWDGRLEVIAVDDGSEPAYSAWLGEKVATLPFPCTLARQENGGQNAARSNGLKLASGKWVLFLDSDDLLDKAVRGLLDHLGETSADVCIIGLQMESSEGEIYESRYPLEQRNISKEAVLERCPSLCGFVARRELLLDGRCDLIEGPRIAEDIASAFRIIATAQSLTSYPFLYRYVMNYSGTTFKPHVEWMLDPIIAFRPLVETWNGGYQDLLAWTVVLHVRLIGCDRVLREVGLRNGRSAIDQLCAFGESLDPEWRHSPYFQRYMQSLCFLERIKVMLIVKEHWRMCLIAMRLAKVLACAANKLFPSSTPNVHILVRRILKKFSRSAS